MILSPTYSLELIFFYVSVGLIFWWILAKKIPSKLMSFTLSYIIILVGSDYYEVPIFVCAYLGLLNHRFPTALTIMNHVLIIVMFLIFVGLTKLKLTKKNVAILTLGPILTAPFLLGIHILYLARAIGLAALLTLMLCGDMGK